MSIQNLTLNPAVYGNKTLDVYVNSLNINGASLVNFEVPLYGAILNAGSAGIADENFGGFAYPGTVIQGKQPSVVTFYYELAGGITGTQTIYIKSGDQVTTYFSGALAVGSVAVPLILSAVTALPAGLTKLKFTSTTTGNVKIFPIGMNFAF